MLKPQRPRNKTLIDINLLTAAFLLQWSKVDIKMLRYDVGTELGLKNRCKKVLVLVTI